MVGGARGGQSRCRAPPLRAGRKKERKKKKKKGGGGGTSSVPMATAGGGVRGLLEPLPRRPSRPLRPAGPAMSLLRGARPRGTGRKGPRKPSAVKRDWDVSASPSRVPRWAPGLLRPRRLFPLLLRLAGAQAGPAVGLLRLGDTGACYQLGKGREAPCPRTCRPGGASRGHRFLCGAHVWRDPICVGICVRRRCCVGQLRVHDASCFLG